MSDVESEWERLTREERELDQQFGGLGEVIHLSGDGPVSGDWHIPLTDYELVGKMVVHCDRLGIGRWCGIPGDLFHMDALSDHMPKQVGAGFERESAVANRVVKHLLRHFDEVVIALGNHDDRLQRRLDYATSFDQTVRMVLHELTSSERARLRVTNRDHFIVDTDEGPWRVCHTRQYSKVQLSVPLQLATIHQMHVAAAHRHHTALGFHPAGFRLAELGGMFDAARTEYLHRWSTTFPKWQPSYMILRDGRMICPALSGE